MKWKKVNEYHMRFGETAWTITYAKNALFPYGLNFDDNSKGFYKTIDEAIDKYHELSQHA
jgi:hypothetical protein